MAFKLCYFNFNLRRYNKGFLMGFWNQVKGMFKGTRVVASCIYLGALVRAPAPYTGDPGLGRAHGHMGSIWWISRARRLQLFLVCPRNFLLLTVSLLLGSSHCACYASRLVFGKF